jgi:hypothetical protein
MEKLLIDFLLELNQKGLINNHDFDYEEVARCFANKDENKQCTIPVVVCSVFYPDGSSVKVECSDFSGKELTKANFDIIIDWLNKEKEKYPDVFY